MARESPRRPLFPEANSVRIFTLRPSSSTISSPYLLYPRVPLFYTLPMSQETAVRSESPFLVRFLVACFAAFAWLALGIANLWAAAALYFDSPVAGLRPVLAIGFLVLVAAFLFVLRGRWKKMFAWLAAFVVVAVWWFSLKPSNDRPWQQDVSRTAVTRLDGNILTVDGVRNCDYRAELDYTCHWDTRQYDLSQLRGVDFFLDNWGSPWIAHPILSFDFGPGGHLAMSIETRKVVGQIYSAIPGFFRQYTLIVIPADERDVVRLRTNYRVGENLSLYRTKATPDGARLLLTEYARIINELHTTPVWYNAVTTNCTTVIFDQKAMQKQKWNWRILLNGKLDEMEYTEGHLVSNNLSFPELKKQAWINPVAKAANDSPDFSELIRQGRVGFESAVPASK
jgi:Domain of unknown function (DUF4105)